MIVTVEISYYPLTENFNTPISEFIDLLSKNDKIKVELGKMSSSITGEYQDVMKTLNESMEVMMETNPSVFNMKISNSCPV
jgi:uncharacterized protein YqgV (UPF0045/DUF77 family)